MLQRQDQRLENYEYEANGGWTTGITTRKEDRNKSREQTASPLNGKKKEFLKKGSRKFLACTGDANTHRGKENSSTMEGEAVQTTTKISNKSLQRKKSLKINQTSIDNSSERVDTSCVRETNKHSMCIPPELLISRLTAQQINRQQTPCVLRQQFSDGRVRLVFKDSSTTEQYLNDMILTQFSNGDWKLKAGNKMIYRLEKQDRWEINGNIL